MVEAGTPANIAALCKDVWSGQGRWMETEMHVEKERLSDIEAIPQGDPWGPLMLNIFMWGGMLEVERMPKEKKAKVTTATPQEESTSSRTPGQKGRKKGKVYKTSQDEDEKMPRKHEVYMDDRTWSAKTAEEVLEPVKAWKEFSDKVFLVEN